MDRTDNFFKLGPAKMSDARVFTDYRTATTREEYNKQKNKLFKDNEYRIYLQENAEYIIENEWQNNKKLYFVNNTNCIHNYNTAVDPQTFYVERSKYDTIYGKKNNLYPCQQYSDYRLTYTKESRC